MNAQELNELFNKVNDINQAGYEKAGYILVDEEMLKDTKYDPQHKTTYNKDEVEVAPLGSPLNEQFHMNVEYNNVKSVVRWLKQQYIERGETLPSGVFQEALEMEDRMLMDKYGEGYDEGLYDALNK